MENPQQVKDKPKSRRFWLNITGIVFACCVLVAFGGVVGAPLVSGAIQGLTGTQSADVTTVTLAPDQSQSAASTQAPSAGPAAGGRGDSVLKHDVWKSLVDFHASNRNCTDVTSTNIEVTQVPDSNAVWQEDWTVIPCGETAVLKVKFTPSPRGGTDYHITQ